MSEVKILFEDDRLLAIHKMANVPFHSEADGLSQNQGMVERVRQSLGSQHLYPVHRLDKITSGIFLFAKNKSAASILSQKFQAREIEKYYLAVSSNKPKKKQGSIIGDMEKGRNGSYLLKKSINNPAISRFKSVSLKSCLSEDKVGESASWLHLFKIETGKTHQIRVALKSLGSPILGDKRYGGKNADRGYLHAYRVRFFFNEDLYEISDEDFSGEQFNLLQTGMTKDSASWLLPETLSWPKKSICSSKAINLTKS